MNNNVTLIVPNWVMEVLRLAHRDWIPFDGTVLLCLVIIAVTAFVKGRVNVKKEEAVAKSIVIKFTTWFSIVLSTLSAIGYFITANMPILKNLPYVGTYMTTVLGIVWFLYQNGVKFESIERKATTMTKFKDQTNTGDLKQSLDPAGSVEPDQFLGQ